MQLGPNESDFEGLPKSEKIMAELGKVHKNDDEKETGPHDSALDKETTKTSFSDLSISTEERLDNDLLKDGEKSCCDDATEVSSEQPVETEDRLAPGDVRDHQSAGSTTTMYMPSFEGLEVYESELIEDTWNENGSGNAEHVSNEGSSDKANDLTVISAERHDAEASETDEDETGMLKPGTKFGQFTVVRYIGGGGMGRVYEGEDRDLERKVAIKVLPKRRAQDGGVVARFLNEAKSAARLNHENIAQVYLYGNVNGIPYIAFEYVEGINLRDYVRENGVLNLSEAIDYVLQAAAALTHAAAHGVTHRDVKPSNIIVTPQKRVKLIDMGLARLLKPQFDDDLTESGVTLGTFDYISPEQARDPRLADVRSDVYSLGCTFYYMLVGAPPFPEGTMLQKLLQHQGDEAPDVREANPNIPVEVAAVVKKMMKKNPEERYQTPEVLISDLLEIADMIGLRISNRIYSETTPVAKEETRRGIWRIPGLCAIALFILFSLGTYLASSKSELALPEVVTPTSPIVPEADLSENKIPGNDEREGGYEVDPKQELTGGNGDMNRSEGSGESYVSSNAALSVELDAVALDKMYAKSNAASSVSVSANSTLDDGMDWRRSYLSAGDSAASSERLAFGWRSCGTGELEESQTYVKYSSDQLTPDVCSASLAAYSTLGAAVESSTNKNDPATIVRVVDRVGKEPNTYSTLQAAIASVTSRVQKDIGDDTDYKTTIRIELKFNDALSTPSLSFTDQKIEIFASKGYRPTLRFEPTEIPAGMGGGCMFLLDGAEATLQDVALDFTVPSQDVLTSEEWSIFEGLGNSSLTMSNSVVTVCNMTGDVFSSPLHSNVAIFRYHNEDIYNDFGHSDATFAVRLEDALIRGEGNLFATERMGARLEAKNCGFNISGSVMYYIEGRNERSNSESRFYVSLDQTVAVSRSCLVRVDSDDYQVCPPFEVILNNSILRLNDQALALIQAPASLNETEFTKCWRINGLLALDVSSFYHRRVDRSGPYQEYPFNFTLAECETIKLSDVSSDASSRLDAVSPHRFSLFDFTYYILNPVKTSTSATLDAKMNAETIKAEFVDVLNDRDF